MECLVKTHKQTTHNFVISALRVCTSSESHCGLVRELKSLIRNKGLPSKLVANHHTHRLLRTNKVVSTQKNEHENAKGARIRMNE